MKLENKQSYLEKYRSFLLDKENKDLFENDLTVQIALGYLELQSSSPSLQPREAYTPQELDLGIEFEYSERRKTRHDLGKLVELSDSHIWTGLPDNYYWIKTPEEVEAELIAYEIGNDEDLAKKYDIT